MSDGASNRPKNWKQIESRLPWVSSFNKQISELDLPRLSGPEIIIATDSGGLHKESPFEVVGILVVDFDNSLHWEAARQLVRKKILRDSRRMAFKSLDEPVRRQALIPFLQAASLIEGVCACVGIHKGIKSLGLPEAIQKHLVETGVLKAKWTHASFDRMARTAHLVSLFVAGLCSEGQNITWISDEDEMFESPEKAEDTRRMLSTFSSLYVKWTPGRLGIGTTKLDKGDRFEEDLASVSDLAAGAFGAALTKLHKETQGQITSSEARSLGGGLSEKAEVIISWFKDDSSILKRLGFVFDHRADGKVGIFRTGRFEF